MEQYPYFPLFFDLSDKHVFVIGAGKIANRRVQILTEFTKHITVIAPEIHPELEYLAEQRKIQLFKKFYESTDIDTADIVLAAVNNQNINQQIYQDCKKKNILVNVCSDHQKCDFYFPGIIRKDSVIVGVTADGTHHKQVKETTELIKQILHDEK